MTALEGEFLPPRYLLPNPNHKVEGASVCAVHVLLLHKSQGSSEESKVKFSLFSPTFLLLLMDTDWGFLYDIVWMILCYEGKITSC